MTTARIENNKYYTYRVTWSEEDREYVGLCTEFPSLSWLADSPQAAFDGIRELVDEVVDDMKARNEPVPEPIATRKYKGVFTVRITPDLHRRIAMKAAESNVSINRLVSSLLSD